VSWPADSAVSISTDEIVEELRQNPELLERFRRALVRSMSDNATDITNLDDESLLRLLREDDKARELAARQLSTRRRSTELPWEDGDPSPSSPRDDENWSGSREDENWPASNMQSESPPRKTGDFFENSDPVGRRLPKDDRTRSSASEDRSNPRDKDDFTRPDEPSRARYGRTPPHPPVNPPNPDPCAGNSAGIQ
jgi:hypothetical protein